MRADAPQKWCGSRWPREQKWVGADEPALQDSLRGTDAAEGGAVLVQD